MKPRRRSPRCLLRFLEDADAPCARLNAGFALLILVPALLLSACAGPHQKNRRLQRASVERAWKRGELTEQQYRDWQSRLATDQAMAKARDAAERRSTAQLAAATFASSASSVPQQHIPPRRSPADEYIARYEAEQAERRYFQQLEESVRNSRPKGYYITPQPGRYHVQPY